jgi:hypothetical protein
VATPLRKVTIVSTVIPAAGAILNRKDGPPGVAPGGVAVAGCPHRSGAEMKTQWRILFAVAGFAVEFGALVALLADPLGAWTGFLVVLAAQAVTAVTYFGLVRPRLARWGATDYEAVQPMPGDDIAGPHARCTTRAVTVGVPACQVWPWLAQLDDGQAGWDSQPVFGTGEQRGPEQIQPGRQQLCPGDRILTIPGPGLEVVAVQDGHYAVARTPDASMSWCLATEPLDQHSCRLISRWRAQWLVTPANARWITLSDPRSFLTERRRLLGLKARAEQATQLGLFHRR